MKIKAQKIYDKIIVLTFDNQYDLTMSFIRMQEFYESPKFKNKHFTLEEYMDWWAKDHNGIFDYTDKWSGFNISGKVICDWNGLYFDDLRDKEYELMMLIRNNLGNNELEDVYVIATYETKEPTKTKEFVLKHELAHAFYYLYPEYKKQCNKMLKNMDKELYEDMSKHLISMGYHKSVIKDEMQAYLISYPEKYNLSQFNEYFGFFVKKLEQAYK
jgi:hypothetical protein